MGEPLVRLEGLKKHFPIGGGVFSRRRSVLKALDGVDLEIARGETLGVVGESGCGKTTLGKTAIRLYEPTAGRIVFDGVDITGLGQSALRPYRRRMQIVFQDPFGSLNPRHRVEDIVAEGLYIHGIVPRGRRRDEVVRLLGEVGLGEDALGRYPHEFSGGQRQRISIARALAVRPEFVVCDEPVSALDVSVQAQIINLFLDLQRKFELTYMFISHDLRVVRHVSDRIAVMYLGKVVESAPAEALYADPLHPYTKMLLASVPDPSPARRKRLLVAPGEMPSPVDPPQGCRFYSRCPLAEQRCALEEPLLRPVGEGRTVACHLV